MITETLDVLTGSIAFVVDPSLVPAASGER